MEPIVRMRGRVHIGASVAAATNVSTSSLNDTFSTQLASMSDMYGLYRFVWLRVTLYPGCTMDSSTPPKSFAVSFTPEVLIVDPTTFQEAATLPFFARQTCFITSGAASLLSFSTTPQHFIVPRKALSLTGVKWFRTQGRGTEVDWEHQGTFVFSTQTTPATSACVFHVTVEYECEFTDQLPLASTLDRLKKQVEQEVVKSLDNIGGGRQSLKAGGRE